MNAGSARALVFACGTAMLLSAVMIAHLTKDGTRSTPEYRSVLRTLLAENPVQVSVSPNGRYVLEKIRGESDFTVCISDRSGRLVAQKRSSDSQLSLTWSRQSDAILYVQDHDGDRNYRLFRYAFAAGTTDDLRAPPIHSASSPLRISANDRRIVVRCGYDGGGELATARMGCGAPLWTTIGRSMAETDYQICADGTRVAFVPAC